MSNADTIDHHGSRPRSTSCYAQIVRHFADWSRSWAITAQDEQFLSCVNDPNASSATALELYLRHCIHEGASPFTVDLTVFAVTWHWDRVHDRAYSSSVYSFDEKSGGILGNPGRSPQIWNLLKSFRSAPIETQAVLTIQELQNVIDECYVVQREITQAAVESQPDHNEIDEALDGVNKQMNNVFYNYLCRESEIRGPNYD
ncbi:hypothetical protein DXG01_001078 [Tephrocybe rancida]|nr:hypothetical protein DXG01_001078 [Tephrocybe rancida]